jgi:hypothetical protein
MQANLAKQASASESAQAGISRQTRASKPSQANFATRGNNPTKTVLARSQGETQVLAQLLVELREVVIYRIWTEPPQAEKMT